MEQLDQEQQKKLKRARGGIWVFIVLALSFIFMVGTDVQLNCNREENSQINCELNAVWMNKFTTRSEAVEGLTGAELEQKIDYDDNNTVSYRVLLHTTQGDVPMQVAFTKDTRDKKAVIDAINQFVADEAIPSAGFALSGKSNTTGIVLGLGFFLLVGVAYTKEIWSEQFETLMLKLSERMEKGLNQ